MKLWKIEKCEIEEPDCPGCDVELKVYHSEHQVLSLEERLGSAIMNCVESESLEDGKSLLVRITLVDSDVKVETGE